MKTGLKLVLLVVLSAGAFAQDFTFVQLCDPQLGRAGYEHDMAWFRLSVHYINDLKPDLVIICGDLIDTAKSAGAYLDFCDIRDQLRMPSYCAIGNNDVPDEFQQYIGADYRSFEHNGFTFIIVNTMLWEVPVPGKTEAQDAWLLATLQDAAAHARPVIVAGHHPLYPGVYAKQAPASDIPQPKVADLFSMFEQYGVVAYLSGHLHVNLVTSYNGILLVTTASTCRNGDGSPLGFRLWHITGSRPYPNEYLAAIDDYAGGRDSDQDGLPDAVEDANQNAMVDPGETDPYNADSDGDGIIDGVERTFGLDPLVPDDVKVPSSSVLGLFVMASSLVWMAGRQIRLSK